jgi:hypothetical protein
MNQRQGVHAAALAVIGWLAMACSGPDVVDRLGGLSEKEATLVNELTSRQMQIGYQIASTSSRDNALELCFEMCGRSFESCQLSTQVCAVAANHDRNAPLAARCDVTRERCRTHRTKIPRQCSCDPTREAGR